MKKAMTGPPANATRADSDGRPFSQILQDILHHLTEIIRAELRLARVEVGHDVRSVAKASTFLITAAVLAFCALGLVLAGMVLALSTTLARWASSLIVAAAVAVIAAICLQIGRKRLTRINLKPEQTIQSIQENVTWMKNQK